MLDPASTPLGRMLLEEITPVVMLLSTPLVEEACNKNGLSFAQLLSPFCNYNNIDVPVRTSSDQPYRLQKFKLRLYYASDIRTPNLEVAKNRLQQVITKAGVKDFSELSADPPQINDVLSRSESEISPSWFQFFNKELISSLSFSEHEAFDHPVACLLAVSSKDEDPTNRVVDLFNTNKLPSLLNDGAVDPKILKHYLLVHDNQDGPMDKATKILTEMRTAFGMNDCELLCINSSPDGKFVHEENPWTPYNPDASPSHSLGCFLDNEDLNEIKTLMQELSSKYVIPFMEQKIRVLNQQVSATRKGFRNQIKNLWWRKGKDEAIESQNGPMYTFSSVESQIRVLGDYAFMLRDYDLALSNYRLISTDYKLDKAWKCYAGVQEMMGLAYFMLDQARKDAEYCMENAFSTYLKLGASGQQNAVRCGLWWIEMLKTRDQFKEAATIYFRICGEDPLLSAVMLEQASYCYLVSRPPMLHKFGFHLILSGDRYKKCDQIKHAIRTYRNAIPVYEGTKWNHIKDHVLFHIGQWYAVLGMHDVAVGYILKVLACSHQSKTTQDLILRDFLQIVQKTGRTFEVLKLQLPVIKTSSLKLVFEDHRTYASPSAASVGESVWHSLEEDMTPSLSNAKTNWLELQSKLIPKKYKESNICVAGEAVKVDIEFQNPLQIPIYVSNVSLICELSNSTDEQSSGANSSTTELPEHDIQNQRNSGDCSSHLTSSEVDFSLEGHSTITVQLTVTPRVEGILKIVGIRWKLSSSVTGFHNFESCFVKKVMTKGRRKVKNPLDGDLKFMVVKGLPKLEGHIHPVPDKTYIGDLQRVILELKNESELPVKNLKMKVSNSRFLCIGNLDDLNAEFPACFEKMTDGENGSLRRIPQDIYSFPEEIAVKKDSPLRWPLWLRAASPGDISLHIVIYYEMGDISSVLKFRTLRMHYKLEVLPSLDVSFHISSYPSRLHEFLLRMDIVNKTSLDSFQIHQLSSFCQQWKISSLQPFGSILPEKSLLSGQAISCFFMLKGNRKSSDSEEIPSSPLPGGDMDLCPLGEHKTLFDVSSSPWSDFHSRERLHQSSSQQGCHSTVDFILITQLLRSNIHSGVLEKPLIFSHHACHCSLSSISPISWLVDGPQTVRHNFSEFFCEVNLKMSIRNSSDAVVSVRVNTVVPESSCSQSNETSGGQSPHTPGGQSPHFSVSDVGWHDIPVVNDIKVTDGPGTPSGKSASLECVSQFLWSASSCTKVQLEPRSTAEIPLQICLFTPGIYDLSNYSLDWTIVDGSSEQSSGVCQGYPYYLTVLQAP